MKKVEFSIIIACFNSEKYIIQCINSILKQTFKSYEIIVIDDNSSDSSVQKIINNFGHLNKLKLIESIKNCGPATSRNKGIEFASGRFITFLDSDDYWDNFFLEKMYIFIRENNYNFVFGSYNRVKEDGSYIDSFIVPSKVDYKGLLKSCPISCLTAILDVNYFGKIYMPEIEREDFGYWLQLLKKTDYAYGLTESLANYRIRKNSLSRNKISAFINQWKVYRNLENFSFFHSIYYIFNYSINGIRKYCSIFFKMN